MHSSNTYCRNRFASSWGANSISGGTDGTVGLRDGAATSDGVGAAGAAGLVVGLEGHTLTRMAYKLYGGRATWDQAGH